MSTNLAMASRVCVRADCARDFTPKPGGWNAKYCSAACKETAQRVRKPRVSRAGQSTYYERVVKLDPAKLTIHHSRASENRRRVREWLAEYKISRGCIDCGFKGHASALQLDHTGKKSIAIADARSSIGRLLTEIEAGKCVVRCANCHSVKTWAEKNGVQYPLVGVEG